MQYFVNSKFILLEIIFNKLIQKINVQKLNQKRKLRIKIKRWEVNSVSFFMQFKIIEKKGI